MALCNLAKNLALLFILWTLFLPTSDMSGWPINSSAFTNSENVNAVLLLSFLLSSSVGHIDSSLVITCFHFSYDTIFGYSDRFLHIMKKLALVNEPFLSEYLLNRFSSSFELVTFIYLNL